MLSEIEEINIESDYKRYKRSLDLVTNGDKHIETLFKDCNCQYYKSKIHAGEECLVTRNHGKITKVLCSECVKNLLKLYKAAIDMENLPYDDDMEEIKRTNTLIELVKWYIHPPKRSEVSLDEVDPEEKGMESFNDTAIISFSDKLRENISKGRRRLQSEFKSDGSF